MSSSALLESPTLTQLTTPQNSTNSSSNSYILSIANLPSYYATSASAPSNVIDLFDKHTLRGVNTLPGHETATTSLRSVDTFLGNASPVLISSGKDGSVKVWDARTAECGLKRWGLVVAGTELQGEDALILYWDPRKPNAPIRTHSSTHSDDITVLAFDKTSSSASSSNLLLSASSDGLLSLSNPEEDDEDEAVLQVGNMGCSISQAGWIDASVGKARVWAASDMETFATWSDEMDQLMSLDIREPSVHTNRTWVTDYLITCHSTSTSRPNPAVFVGSNEGDAALLSNMNPSVSDAPWFLHILWTNNHVGIVRSLLWDEQNQVIVTGGEDSKLNLWACPP
ncbi:WD40-repeat-containing domain protein [Cyathus striatus]|nr:WD40-repeat-containing domain protein [Cyathus striatus]